MGECLHYSDAFDCPRHCAVAEVGGRHLDLGESCLVGPINGEGRYLKDWPELCYRYQRARAEAAEKRAMAEHSRAEAAESELAEAKEVRNDDHAQATGGDGVHYLGLGAEQFGL